MLVDMRTDLKDSGALWSNAELTRCVERAVSDLSRFLPQERIYEESLEFTVTDESFTTPLDTDIDRVVDGESLNGKVSGNTCTVDGQPDIPRPLTATIVDADDSVTGLVIIISGFDEENQTQTETLAYAVGQSKTLTGKLYFKYVSSVELNQVGGTPGAGDTIELGIGAYTTVWVSLDNKPIKSATDDTSTGARNTDYYMDYANGRIKAISGGLLAANTAYTISYKKSQLSVDLSALANFIRVSRVEYPVGDVPQSFISWGIFANILTITGSGESESQGNMAEDKNIRVYYESRHLPPTSYTPSTVPSFLEDTVLMAAAAYALLIYSLNSEHQSLTDLGSARTALAAATTAQTALGTALTNAVKYLNNNSAADAAGILQDITDDVLSLRTAIGTALDAANAFLDEVDVTDLQGAEAVWTTEVDYVTGASSPSAKDYLDDGDALLNTIVVGGEGTEVSLAYAQYAIATYNSITRAFEQKRTDFLQEATARTNAALGFVQEAVQRLSNIRTYIDQSGAYVAIAGGFVQEAQYRLGVVQSYLQQAAQYVEAAGGDLVMADRFKAEAMTKRDEVWGVWRDRKQYIGEFADSSVRQMP